ncbi:MAG: glycosyltransferase family 2 protein [Candidatus Eremiobacteraeota bacterium]|nr:glycosyltransferase family 2 protein [Candidatus Eremiobacteraeota bacterium]
MEKGPVECSIVIPVMNEQDNIRPLYDEIVKVLAEEDITYEIIFVDDGSTDETFDRIKELAEVDSGVNGLSFSRNFGHQMALTAGMDYAKGDCVITMDGDLQHPPSLIPEMLKRWREGNEIVYTVRKNGEKLGLVKRLGTRIFYFLITKFSGMKMKPNTPDFRLFDRRVVEVFRNLPERARYIRGLTFWVGFKKAEIPFFAAARHSGDVKYSFGKMLGLAISAITSFSRFPLQLSFYFGLSVAFISFIYAIYAIWQKIFNNNIVPGWTSILISVLFLGGVQLITAGILGEYIAQIYDEVKARPLYILREKAGKSLTTNPDE